MSDQGAIRSLIRGEPRLLRPYVYGKGYPKVTLYQGGKRTQYVVHQLVMAVFVGPPPPGHEVRHVDGNTGNAALSNLTYGTPSQNTQDSVAHGTHHHARKTHCPAGHPYDDANTYLWGNGRKCRACRVSPAAVVRAYQARKESTDLT